MKQNSACFHSSESCSVVLHRTINFTVELFVFGNPRTKEKYWSKNVEPTYLYSVKLQNFVRNFFLNCALFVFRQTCEENRPILTTSLKSVALCYQVCSLFCIVARFFQENASKLSKIRDDGNSSEASHEVEISSLANADNAVFPPNLLAEWQEFFSGPLFNTVLRLFMFHAGEWRVVRFGLFQRRKGEG